MRYRIFITLLALLLFGPLKGVRAQVTRADTAAVLLRAAEVFQGEGRWEVAEALFQHIGERFPDTSAGARALEALRRPAAGRVSRSSQVELQVWSTLYGAWLGIAVPGAFGADDPGPYGAGLLVGGPAGFLAGRALARSRALSEGQVRAITFGGTWGTWQGFGMAELLDWGEKEVCDLDFCYVDDSNGEEVLKAMVLGGLAGIGTGVFLARKPISSGVATTANFGALWGTWFGVAGGILAGLEGDDLLAATLLAGNGGLVSSALMAPTWNLTRERARLISIAGVIGALGGVGLDLIVQPDDEKVAMALPLLGSVAGLGLGAVWTADPPSPSRAQAEAGPGAPLLSLEGNRWRLDPPGPFPTVALRDGPRGPVAEPALGLTLFRARF